MTRLGDAYVCNLCRSAGLVELAEFASLPRVTSDCRPWPSGGRLAFCPACGCVQKPVDDDFRRELDAIYADYAMYLQAGGNEQRALDASTGALDPRSRQILSGFLAGVELPRTGHWLDIGCGNGATLRAVAELLPDWTSVGTELDDRNRDAVESIAGVERLHAGPLETLDETFDVISMIHVLEHVENPVAFLRSLGRLLRPAGVVFVELPNSLGNCFDLAIADHVTHFDEASLRACFERAGLEVASSGHNFLEREVFVSGRSAAHARAGANDGDAVASRKTALDGQLEWLDRVASEVRGVPGTVGVFGSSIGGTYAYAARAGGVDFFVDEDPDRIGRSHLDVPIRGAAGLDEAAAVYVSLPRQLAERVCAKDGRERWLMPPEYRYHSRQRATT